MTIYKLVAEYGMHWVTSNFRGDNVVWLMDEKDALRYRLFDENYEPVELNGYEKYMVEVKVPFDHL